jgi:hypothetical protein
LRITSKLDQGILTESGRLNTVDLLIKVACFVKKRIMFALTKATNQNKLDKEVNCTEASRPVRLPG